MGWAGLCERSSHHSLPWYHGGISNTWQHVWDGVLWVQLYNSGQSKSNRLAVSAVMDDRIRFTVISVTLITLNIKPARGRWEVGPERRGVTPVRDGEL